MILLKRQRWLQESGALVEQLCSTLSRASYSPEEVAEALYDRIPREKVNGYIVQLGIVVRALRRVHERPG